MEQLIVSPSPHLRGEESVSRLMRTVLIALLPAFAASLLLFGWRALAVVAVTVASCLAAEYISRRVMKRSNTLSDRSAVVTGLLLSFSLPPAIPLWMPVMGSVVAIVVIKQFFGGIGQNFINPALGARIVLMVSFPAAMTDFTRPVTSFLSPDAVTAATPLGVIAEGGGALPSYADMFFGLRAGSLGETCAVALLLGGLLLIGLRVISPTIPVCYIGTVALLSLCFGLDPIAQILSGGLLLGAIFMATDYTTSPITPWGRAIFGVGCGAITMLIRRFANLPEGVSYAIVLMNILVPYIERLTRPRPMRASPTAKTPKTGAF